MDNDMHKFDFPSTLQTSHYETKKDIQIKVPGWKSWWCSTVCWILYLVQILRYRWPTQLMLHIRHAKLWHGPHWEMRMVWCSSATALKFPWNIYPP